MDHPVAVITGATSGLGCIAAFQLARQGTASAPCPAPAAGPQLATDGAQ
ncbi:hypothetical protein ACIGAN_26320 [Streptomyces sp. NPDC085931]